MNLQEYNPAGTILCIDGRSRPMEQSRVKYRGNMLREIVPNLGAA